MNGNMCSRVRVSIVRWLDDDPQPGIVECLLIDRFGKEWGFIGKCAYFSAEILNAFTTYPKPGVLLCRILSLGIDAQDREFAVIDTEEETVSGVTCFDVFVDQLSTLDQ